MFADPFVLTYDSVARNLNRVNQDNRSSEYYLDDGTEKFTLQVKHTVPARGKAKESHLLRLDVEHYDANGVYLHTTSAWLNSLNPDSPQVTVDLTDTVNCLVAAATSGNVDKLMTRQV